MVATVDIKSSPHCNSMSHPKSSQSSSNNINVRGIPKPKNVSSLTIKQLKMILGFDEMEDPKGE